MDDLKKAAPHLIMATVVVIAVSLLAIDKVLTGGEALGSIAAASGFTLGVTGASGSISGAAAAVEHVSNSISSPVSAPAPLAAVKEPPAQNPS